VGAVHWILPLLVAAGTPPYQRKKKVSNFCFLYNNRLVCPFSLSRKIKFYLESRFDSFIFAIFPGDPPRSHFLFFSCRGSGCSAFSYQKTVNGINVIDTGISPYFLLPVILSPQSGWMLRMPKVFGRFMDTANDYQYF